MKRILLIISIALLSISCGNKKTDGTGETVDSTETSNFQENDILALNPIPPDIKEWLDFYSALDTGFNIQNFVSSGVNIQIDSLPNAIAQTDEKIFKSFLAYSPDSNRYVDFLSYNQFIEKDSNGKFKVTTGDPDQETKLVDRKKNISKQLLYYGPLQAVEAAGWLSNDVFLLGMMSLEDSSRSWIPEIYLFNLKDSTFTNFRLKKTINADSLVFKDKSFFDSYFQKRNVTRY